MVFIDFDIMEKIGLVSLSFSLFLLMGCWEFLGKLVNFLV